MRPIGNRPLNSIPNSLPGGLTIRRRLPTCPTLIRTNLRRRRAVPPRKQRWHGLQPVLILDFFTASSHLSHLRPLPMVAAQTVVTEPQPWGAVVRERSLASPVVFRGRASQLRPAPIASFQCSLIHRPVAQYHQILLQVL